MDNVGIETARPSSAGASTSVVPNGDEVQDEEVLTSVIVVGDDKPGDSLQDAFAKFREQKKSERRLQKACRVPGNRSQELKDELRNKFIEQAHKYMGVPYHERYKEEGTEAAPLYLDCCGLVRRCVQDLKEEFGFLIGRWNQVPQNMN